jgi:hypothetical protein
VAKRSLRGKIAILKDRFLVIHPATEPVIRWCSVCQCDSPMVVPDEAARCWGANVRTVYRWMDAGTVHFLEVPGGILVCLNSIKT